VKRQPEPGLQTAKRRKAHQLGHSAELRAVWRLRLGGWTILARRYRTGLGEVDIVARRGKILAFVEVKARGDVVRATEALTERQFGRASRAASLFLAQHPRHAGCSVRFDAILVGGSALGALWPRHLPDVWQPPE
jgi:putative endonuclease